MSVEHVGSSSVLGLLAKPIIDLAVGVSTKQNLAAVTIRLEAGGWINRGDARGRYEAVKLLLVAEHRDDRKAYTGGKSPVVNLLLRTVD